MCLQLVRRTWLAISAIPPTHAPTHLLWTVSYVIMYQDCIVRSPDFTSIEQSSPWLIYLYARNNVIQISHKSWLRMCDSMLIGWLSVLHCCLFVSEHVSCLWERRCVLKWKSVVDIKLPWNPWLPRLLDLLWPNQRNVAFSQIIKLIKSDTNFLFHFKADENPISVRAGYPMYHCVALLFGIPLTGRPKYFIPLIWNLANIIVRARV